MQHIAIRTSQTYILPNKKVFAFTFSIVWIFFFFFLSWHWTLLNWVRPKHKPTSRHIQLSKLPFFSPSCANLLRQNAPITVHILWIWTAEGTLPQLLMHNCKFYHTFYNFFRTSYNFSFSFIKKKNCSPTFYNAVLMDEIET